MRWRQEDWEKTLFQRQKTGRGDGAGHGKIGTAASVTS